MRAKPERERVSEASMCGISGFNFQDEGKIKEMMNAQGHRGPDDSGVFSSSGITLGHNRLSIIDLSPAGHQPMEYAEGRFTITYNGELYNFKELKEGLEAKGHKFKSKSDTEVILAAYAEWGADCFKRFNGIFAFAIWDRDKSELVLVRDHVGVKPFYYFWDGQRFIFSSEIKAILSHGVLREIDQDSLNIYFRFLYVPGPKTIFKNIFKLPAGNFAILKNGNLTIKPYWELKQGETIGKEEAKKQIISLFEDSIRRQLVSDRPLGVFLSGGLDSTAVLSAMSKVAPGKIKTFSIGYEATAEEEKYNADFNLAARTAAHFGAEHHPIKISGRDVADCFEDVVYHMDEPVSNHIQPSTYLLAKHARTEVVVALGGDGGDELFGGYDRYYYNYAIDRLRTLSAPVASVIGRLSGNKSLREKIAIPPGEERFLSFMAQKEEKISSFLKNGVNRSEAALRVFEPYFSQIDKDFTNQMMIADLKTWLPDESLVRSDKLSMAWGLEERVPILDYRLAELAFRIPSKYKIGSRVLGKKIFRESLDGLIPDFIVKEKKRGFFSPASKWLRGDLKDFAYDILSPGFCRGTEEYFDFEAVRKILDDHIAIRGYGLTNLWSLMTFQVWYKKFMS